MKKILILLILSISVVNLYSQNYEPGALPFDWGNYRNQPFNPNEGQFKQEKFLTGFQWTGSQKFNKLMKNNANAGGTGFDSNSECSEESVFRLASLNRKNDFFTTFRING